MSSLQADLQEVVRGDVRFDRLTRALYATDASIYEITPAGVVMPRDVDDVVAAVRVCRGHLTPIVPRGAGTGLTGGAVGRGVNMDFSRYMNRIVDLDLAAGTVRVEPGVVLDELNAFLAPHGVHFAPDVATSNRATIGGMIANNSCGAHSVVYKRTVDHVVSVNVVLSDGSVTTWPSSSETSGDLTARVESELARIVEKYHDQIAARFPKVLRRNSGYALDGISSGASPINAVPIICGSEGTLCLVVEATLRLTPLPAYKAMLVVHFHDLLEAMSAASLILEHQPAAVELLDRMILDAASRDACSQAGCEIVDTSAQALLIVEFFDDTSEGLQDRVSRLRQVLAADHVGYNHLPVFELEKQCAVYDMRKRGLGLLMAKPGDVRGYAFVEDTAVDPGKLRDYIQRFLEILRDEGICETALYAHASVGEIHVRPALNLKTADDVSRMHRIAERVSDLVLTFAGSNSGEHGDGIVRSCWIEKMYGPAIAGAFKEVKEAFDPDGLFNPGKIVDALPMTENLRFGPAYRSRSVKTHLDFGACGGLAGMAEMCSGVGQCRQKLVGTMCPSFAATNDEMHTTRARANALRLALSSRVRHADHYRSLLDGMGDAALDDVMDLCLMCKACKTECPTGVDMARMKAEWLAHRHLRHGVPRGDRFMADAPRFARLGSCFPGLTNLLMGCGPVRGFLERRYGLDRRVPPPRLARRTFRHWFSRRSRSVWDRLSSRSIDRLESLSHRSADGRRVVYFVDTWTNYFTPQVGIAAVSVLEAAGYSVVVPDHVCCGRTFISKGLLTEARHLANVNVRCLAGFADLQTPIVGTEPSCILTLVDEYPQLVRTDDAKRIAALTRTLTSFLDEAFRHDPAKVPFTHCNRRILYHGHCHEKALVGTSAALQVLNQPPGFDAQEINSGCCGMAGGFGHEKAHHDVAAAIGDQRLFPAVRDRNGAEIAVSGFSCRHQIAYHTGVLARHIVEHLADALPEKVS